MSARANPPSFRPEDEALLARLSDEARMRALWSSQTPPGTPDLPRRAARLLGLCRAVSGGDHALRRADEGDLRALHALIAPPAFEGYSPELVHTLAVYFGRVSAAYAPLVAKAVDGDVANDAWVMARLRSLAAWFALSREHDHLLRLATELSHGALSSAQLDALTLDLDGRALEELGRIAREDAGVLSAVGRCALEVLERVDEASKIAGLDAAKARANRALAERARAAAIDEAISALTPELEEARLSEPVAQKSIRLFAKIHRAWVWSGRDEALERFAVDAFIPIGWMLYRPAQSHSQNWADLRALLVSLADLSDSLEARILADPVGQVAYAAKCAQLFVFRSETATDKARELALAERALAVCPTHRNARLITARILCERAIASLDRSTFLTSRRDLPQAAELVARAESLFPQSQFVPLARTKISEAKGRWGASA